MKPVMNTEKRLYAPLARGKRREVTCANSLVNGKRCLLYHKRYPSRPTLPRVRPAPIDFDGTWTMPAHGVSSPRALVSGRMLPARKKRTSAGARPPRRSGRRVPGSCPLLGTRIISARGRPHVPSARSPRSQGARMPVETPSFFGRGRESVPPSGSDSGWAGDKSANSSGVRSRYHRPLLKYQV